MREFNSDDLVSTFTYKGIKSQLFWDGKTDQHGKCVFSYITSYKGTELLKGNDLHIPANIAPPDTYKAMVNYLSWLVVREGDTDRDFFKEYSPEALNFVNTNTDLDQVRVFIWDWESGEAEPIKRAEKWFKRHIKL